MNLGPTRPVPAGGVLVAALSSLLCGCLGAPAPDTAVDPMVVTEAGPVATPEELSPERAAAIAEMRRQAEAADQMDYPDVFQSSRNAVLATREEPMPVADVAAIQAELAEIARRQQAAVSPAEIAYLKARAAELQRLAAEAQLSLRP